MLKLTIVNFNKLVLFNSVLIEAGLIEARLSIIMLFPLSINKISVKAAFIDLDLLNKATFT